MKIRQFLHIKKYIIYFAYYLETFAKRLSGRGKMNPEINGEYNVLKNIIKNSDKEVCLIDGGANVGKYSEKFLSLCLGNNKKPILYSIEPFPNTMKKLQERIGSRAKNTIQAALGSEPSKVKLYYGDINSPSGGTNSLISHYYLNDHIEVDQKTLDSIVEDNNIKKIDFLKLDIEGAEYNALLGSLKILSNQIVSYIQLEYNQTWIAGGGTIKKVLDLCGKYGYQLFIISKNELISVPSYHFILDDFYFCNLLLVKNGLPLCLPHHRKALPFI